MVLGRRSVRWAAFLLLFSLALALRLAYITWGIPGKYVYQMDAEHSLYPDEATLVDQMVSLAHHFPKIKNLTYPPLEPILGSALVRVFGVSARGDLFLLARLLSVMASIALVWVVYRFGAHLGDDVGLVAALFFAVAMLPVNEAHWANPESLQALLVFMAAFFAWRAAESFKWQDLLLLGLCLGLGICAKLYSALFLHLPLLAFLAHLQIENKLQNIWHFSKGQAGG